MSLYLDTSKEGERYLIMIMDNNGRGIKVFGKQASTFSTLSNMPVRDSRERERERFDYKGMTRIN